MTPLLLYNELLRKEELGHDNEQQTLNKSLSHDWQCHCFIVEDPLNAYSPGS